MQKICANELSEENNYCSLPLLQANTWAMFDRVISSGDILNLQCNGFFDVSILYVLNFQSYIFLFLYNSDILQNFKIFFLYILNVCRNGNFGDVFKFHFIHT